MPIWGTYNPKYIMTSQTAENISIKHSDIYS